MTADHYRPGRIGMWMPLLEACEASRRVLVVSAYKSDLGMRGGCGRQNPQLLHAGGAPGRPEVHDDRFALQLPHAHLVSMLGFDRQPWRGLAEDRGVGQGRVL